jgi:predicted chitinase
MKEFGITKPVDQAMFIAQVGMSQLAFTSAGGKLQLLGRTELHLW